MQNKFRNITCLIALLIFIPVCSFSASLNLEERVIEHTFKNGLKVLMMERHQAATVTAFIRMNVGSVDEVTGNTGIAHMLEHMLFKGTKTLGTVDYGKEKPILDEIDKVAAALDAENRKGVRMDKAKAGELKSKLKELQAKHKPFVIPDEFSQLTLKTAG